MTRKDALTILNACFPVNIISYLHDAIDDSEHDFFVIQEQLLLAIMLDYNRCIWKSFIHDPEQFKQKYQDADFTKRTAKNAITEFFKKNSITIPADAMPKGITNETQILEFGVDYYNKNADQTFTGMYPVVSLFDEFWNLSCEIAGITRDKRKSADYTPAKIDAFIYFNALYSFYGQNFKDWEPDLRMAKIEMFTRKELAVPISSPDGSTFEFVAMGGMKGEYFRCNLMDSILDRCRWSIDNAADRDFKLYPNWNWHLDLPASLLFAPTSKIIKHILSTALYEQSSAIQIIASDKDFWGHDWDVSRESEAIFAQISQNMNELNERNLVMLKEVKELREEAKITKNIVESNQAYYEKFETLFNKKSDGTGINKLPSIPEFEEAVADGYLSQQDSEGHYRTIKSLSELFDKHPKLIGLTPMTLQNYIRKSNGNKYGKKTIPNYLYSKKP